MRQINLLPVELQNAQKLAAQKQTAVIVGVLALVILLFIHFVLAGRAAALRKELAQPVGPLIDPKTQQLQGQLEQVKNEKQSLLGDNRVLTDVLSRDFVNSNIFRIISDITTDKVWLTSMIISSHDKKCYIKGRSYNTRLVSEFMLELKKLDYCSNLDLSSMEKEENSELKEIEFSIECLLE